MQVVGFISIYVFRDINPIKGHYSCLTQLIFVGMSIAFAAVIENMICNSGDFKR